MRFFIVFAAILVGLCHGKMVEIKNGGSDILTVKVTGKDAITLHPGLSHEVDVSGDWKGRIQAWNSDCQSKCNEVATAAEFAMGAASDGMDKYDVSVLNGFNRRMKIAPTGDLNRQCKSALCEAHINHKCPKDNQVQDNLGHIVACRNDELLFKKLCPLAVTSPNDNGAHVYSCNAEKYLVIIG